MSGFRFAYSTSYGTLLKEFVKVIMFVHLLIISFSYVIFFFLL